MEKMDYILGVVLVALGIAMIVVARGIPAVAGLAVGPSLFPILIGGGMILVGVAIIIGTKRTQMVVVNRTDISSDACDDQPIDPFLSWNLALVAGLILVFLLIVDFVGFSIASFAIIFALLRAYHRERLISDFVLTIIAVFTIFILFSSVFRVSLPVGPVEILIFKIIG
ncbi:tripartite tricarboxylate transporter TctB family protein [Ahrensia kielensis]|uniref:Tripartite tricarboxylate transporter TctB family protein n=1 Tax=Ahrensia kielensis TaxID=76980 RepID=A0ABU9T2S0_9HYPH